MPAPIPRTTDAVWTIVVSVVVFKVISPVVWVFSDCHDCTSELLVVSDGCGHILRDHDRILLVSEKIDRRGLCLLDKCLGVRL